MKKNFKRVLSCLLAIIMCICAVPMGDISMTANAAVIPSDAVEFNGHYYKMYENTNKTWSEAKAFCEESGGHLATVTSNDEQEFINSLIASGKSYSYWIGGYYIAEENAWKWITGENWDYTSWSAGEPSLNGEDKLSIYRNTVGASLHYNWNDVIDAGPWSKTDIMGLICEWECGKKFPDGYNFEEDSYSFENWGEKISKKYFTTLYESAPGKEFYDISKGGLCFGMAYTTAAIYNGLPAATSIYDNHIFSDSTYCNVLRDASKSSKIMCGDNEISIKDYIKYAFIYQFSSEAEETLKATANDVNGLKNAVKAYLSDNHIGVAIGMTHCFKNENNEWESDGGHEVLAVGIDGNDILIDDPNNKDSLERITINDDGSWSFSGAWTDDGVSSANSVIDYSTDIYRPYQVLLTGNKATVAPSLIEKNTNETYVEGMTRLDKDNVLLSVDSDDYTMSCSNHIELTNIKGIDTTADNDTADMYWVRNDKTVTISELKGENNTVSLAGDDTIIDANVTEGTAVTMTIDENDINAQLDTQKGAECDLSFESTGNNEEDIIIEVSGTSSDTQVTATQTETGLTVTGISDGTVTLSKDDEVISTQKITNADSDIDIKYDKDGATGELDVDYDAKPCEHYYVDKITKEVTCTTDGVMTYTCSKCGDTYTEVIVSTGHNDKNNDGKCDICDEIMDSVKTCTHLCHKSGIVGFIWKIINIFNKLFKANRYCECGAAHY